MIRGKMMSVFKTVVCTTDLQVHFSTRIKKSKEKNTKIFFILKTNRFAQKM